MSRSVLQSLHKDFMIVDRKAIKAMLGLLKGFLKGRVKRYEYAKFIREIKQNGLDICGTSRE